MSASESVNGRGIDTATDRDFYVTVRDAGKVGFLLGPYATHAEALAEVRRGRDLACAANNRAWFYSFGTSSLPKGTPCRVVFAGEVAAAR